MPAGHPTRRHSLPEVWSLPSDRAPAARRPAGIAPILNAIAKTAARLCDAHYAQIRLVEGNQVRVVAKYGSLPGSRRLGQLDPLTRDTATGAAILDRRTVHIRDLKAGDKGRYPKPRRPARRPRVSEPFSQRPSSHEGTPLGTIVIHRTTVRPFTSKQIALLEAFAEHAATAIEETRLAQVLAEALEQQTATAEILRVISSSPTDLQPVMDVVAESAARFCGAVHAAIWRLEGDSVRLVAVHGSMLESFPDRQDHRHESTERGWARGA